ncbi:MULTISPECIES: SpoIIIAH-like family protein [Paenibacillus]|uniref:SpoIIIAH-like family protein n=1 Tax=Paenibacillus TaxID=44249 RepID=UPI0022B8B5A1|nr:SpoIIIAH-like family protein [Paenibacillus caseinilyticus]MCZ8520645.1 SpoIIIAH-like family protein [Paenibacillus caseinilyticus]
MNTKRQTVWLVSMLSLMVVLSAYYLFTEDVNQVDVKTAGTAAKELTLNTGQLDGLQQTAAPEAAAKQGAAAGEGAKADGKSAAQTEPKTDAKAADPKAPDSKAADPKAAEPKADAQSSAPEAGQKAADNKNEHKESSTKTDKPSSAAPGASDTPAAQPVSKTESSLSAADAKVLQQLQTGAQSGTGYFNDLQMTRETEISKKSEQLVNLIADTKQTTQAAADAQAELLKLQDLEAKIEYFEGQLSQTYHQAVVTQDGAKWKVTVQADKLDRSQAYSITDQAMKELGIAKENIAVTFKP